ncbi:MAG: DNA 3'-phosphatase [Nitrospinae bacterium]|nr:DNA 3'-phosphatase [Nitrospinota bacterium]
MDWLNKQTCYYFIDKDTKDTNEFIAFDFDDTLVDLKTKNILDNVLNTLTQLYNTGYRLVIFSNQMGISKKKTTHKEIRDIFMKFRKHINIPIHIFYSIDSDIYRKPNIGMYNLFTELYNNNNIKYYCGDAAGRKKDFSASDLYFANNSGLEFKTPEEVFYNKIPKYLADRDTPKLELYKKDIWKDGKLDNPRKLFNIYNIEKYKLCPKLDTSKKILVIIIGPPGVGKSSLSKVLSEKYNLKIINNDSYVNIKQTKIMFDKYKKEEDINGIIIDNCNSKKTTRDFWINRLNDTTWNIFYIYFQIDKSISIHLTKYRTFNGYINIPLIAIHKYYKDLEIPTEENMKIFKMPLTIMDNYNHNLRFTWN